MRKKVLVGFLTIALCMSLMPVNVLAETGFLAEGGGEASEEEIASEEKSIDDVDNEDGYVDETEEEDASSEIADDASIPVTTDTETEQEDEESTESEVLTGEGSFLYEDADLTLRVHISGDVELPDAAEAVSWEDVTMNASILGENSSTYNQIESYAEESSGDLSKLIVMTLSFLYDETELDVSDCDIDVTAEVSQDVIDEAMPDSDDEEETSSVSVTMVEPDDDYVNELDSVTVSEDDDTDDVELSGELNDDEFGIMLLSADDPTFTVQFYANLDVIYREHHGEDTDLSVIETHTDNGAVLPSNGTTPQTSVIELKPTGNGDYVMDSENVLTQMYVDESYEFVDEPDLHHMNKLEVNSDYELKEIWKLKEGKDAESTVESDWDVYEVSRIGDSEEYTKDFTNDPEAAAKDDSLILVQDNDIFRFVYDTTSNTANLDTNFYDYNITDGNVYSSASTSSAAWSSGTKYVYTQEAGINSSGNYAGTGTKYAFGNRNTGTGLGDVLWNGNRLNANNSSSYGNGYQGCTFGIVSGLDTSDNVVFSSGINAPNVFYGEASGKETFTGQLFFNREGDTYTLSSAQLSDGTNAGSNLETFTGRSEYEDGTRFSGTIYSNDFWPMDKVSYDGMDPQFGNYADYVAGNVIQRFDSSGTTGALPPSDDSLDHNSFFGMNFEIEFSYTSDYVGPLEYFFFGDDDMWVFLDDKLILDIGGVHSSVGEHVDLWDYLSQDAQPTADGDPVTYTHTLSVYYTERGASGSTCYIQYTLPEVSSVTPVEDASNLLIEKEVEGTETDQEFEFTLTLKDGESEDAKELTNQYSYIVLNEAGNFEYSDVIKSGETFTLKDGWSALIRNLPNGTVATVTETNGAGFSTTYEVGTVSGDDESVDQQGTGTEASGTVSSEGTTYIKFINSYVPEKGVDADGDGTYDDSGMQAKVGDTLSYEITFENVYDAKYDDDNNVIPVKATITDVLDEGLDYVKDSAKLAVYDEEGNDISNDVTYTVTYDEDSRTLTCEIPDMPAHAEGVFTFQATVNETALVKNEIENTAEIQIGDHPLVETNPVYTPVPGKDVDADGDGTYGDSGDEVQVGDTLTYEITFRNDYDPEYDESGEIVPVKVTVIDIIDPGLDYEEGSAALTVYDADGNETVVDCEITYDATSRTLKWVISDMPAYSEGVATFKATVNKTAWKENKVKNTGTVEINNVEEVTNEVDNPVPDKDVDANGDKEYGDSGLDVNVGDTLTYIIYYDNEYNYASTVTITDTLDEGLDYVMDSASDSGTYDEDTRTITWAIDDVPAHFDGSVTFQAVVNEKALVEDEVNNTATVEINNIEKQTNTVHNPVPDKNVDIHGDGTYDDNGEQVHVGDTLTYKIDYFNGHSEDDDDYEGPVTVTIRDVLDDGLDYVSSDPEAEVSTEDGHTVLTWTIEGVEAQTGSYVTFTATVNENALVKNKVENKASVQVNGDPSVDTNTVYNPVPDKDVNVDNEDEDEEGEEPEYGDHGHGVQVGYILTYRIRYYNGDDDPATVTITDKLDEGVDYVIDSASDDGEYDESSHTITWEIPNVAAHTGGYVTFEVIVNSNARTNREIENSANVKIGNHADIDTNTIYNPVPSKDVDADEDGEYGDSGLQVQVGDTLTYIIYYMNSYDDPATVTITDVLDEGLDYVSSNPNATVSTDEDGHTVLTWTIEDVPGRDEEREDDLYVTFTATVNETALVKNEVDNTASVQVNDDPAVNTNTVWNPIPEKDVDADEDGEYGDSGMQVQVGDKLTYTIDYFNGEDDPAKVTITDVLDDGLDYVEDSAGENATYDEETHTITWVIEEVEAHTGGSVSFQATVNDTAVIKNEVDNKATVDINNHEAVTNEVYNPVPDKDVDADGDGEYGDSGKGVKVDDELTYEINYFNGYEISATVTITDVLDKGLDFVEASDDGTYDEETRTITWVIENVAALEGGSVTFTAKVNEDALLQDEIKNDATVKIENESETTVKTNEVENPVRKYFPIDEEIVPDENDRSTWVKEESVNEYNAIEIEMTTQLPIIIPEELAEGNFVMYFHNELVSQLNLDEDKADFTVYIAGREITDDYYTITFDDDTGDDCNFHVDVDLTKLYNDEIVTDDMLDGNTDITIFFYADLEGTGLNASYTSTIWYDVYDGDKDDEANLEYTSNKDVVTVYTYEIEISKVDGETGEALAGATFGIYYDEDCDDPIYRYTGHGFDEGQKQIYTIVSDEDGSAIFYGLAEGTYYVKELRAPNGYVLEDTPIKVEITHDLQDSGHIYSMEVKNTPIIPEEPQNPRKFVETDGDDDFLDDGQTVNVGDDLTYRIYYYNHYDTPVTVTVTDTLDYALDFVSATNGGVYDESTRTITWTIENAAAESWGYVEFTATANDIARIEIRIENTASAQIGDDEPVDTNLVKNPTPDATEGTTPKTGTGSPKTSDTNNISLWLALLVAAMAAVVVALRMRRRS